MEVFPDLLTEIYGFYMYVWLCIDLLLFLNFGVFISNTAHLHIKSVTDFQDIFISLKYD